MVTNVDMSSHILIQKKSVTLKHRIGAHCLLAVFTNKCKRIHLAWLLGHQKLESLKSYAPAGARANEPHAPNLGNHLDGGPARDIIHGNVALICVENLHIGLSVSEGNLGLGHRGILTRWVNLGQLAVGVLQELAGLLLAEPSHTVGVGSVNQAVVKLGELVEEQQGVLVTLISAERQVHAVRHGVVLGAIAVSGDAEGQVHRRELQGDLGLGTIFVHDGNELATHLVLLDRTEANRGGLESLSGVNGSHCGSSCFGCVEGY